MTKGTVSQTLTALERKDLIRKVPVPTDRRNVRLELTRRGRALLNKDPLADLELAAGSLTAKEQVQLSDGLKTLLATVLETHGGKPFGACRTCRYFQKDHDDGKPHRCGLLEETLSETDSELVCVEQEAPG